MDGDFETELDGDIPLKIKRPCAKCQGSGMIHMNTTGDDIHCIECEGSGVIGDWVLLSVFLAGWQQNIADLTSQVEELSIKLARVDAVTSRLTERMSAAENRLNEYD